MHGLAGIDAKELGDRVTQRARRRRVAHLHRHAGAAIPVLVEAHETGMVDL